MLNVAMFRIAYSGRGAFTRFDGVNWYLLFTKANDPYGTFNDAVSNTETVYSLRLNLPLTAESHLTEVNACIKIPAFPSQRPHRACLPIRTWQRSTSAIRIRDWFIRAMGPLDRCKQYGNRLQPPSESPPYCGKSPH
jgi:hypothetical protein